MGHILFEAWLFDPHDHPRVRRVLGCGEVPAGPGKKPQIMIGEVLQLGDIAVNRTDPVDDLAHAPRRRIEILGRDQPEYPPVGPAPGPENLVRVLGIAEIDGVILVIPVGVPVPAIRVDDPVGYRAGKGILDSGGDLPVVVAHAGIFDQWRRGAKIDHVELEFLVRDAAELGPRDFSGRARAVDGKPAPVPVLVRNAGSVFRGTVTRYS